MESMSFAEKEDRERKLQMLRDPSSEYYKQSLTLLLRSVSAEDLRVGGRKKVATVVLDYGLRSVDVSFLSNYFGMVVESKVTGVASFTPFFDAFSKCMSRRLADMKVWPGEDVIVAEGDVRQVVARVAPWMHVCRFSLNPLNLVRYVEEQDFLNRTCRSKNAQMAAMASSLVRQLKDCGGTNVCVDGASCSHQCDTIIFQPEHVQVGAAQVADLMIRHGAVRAKGWTFLSREMICGLSGTLLGGRIQFVVDEVSGVVSFFESHSEELVFSHDVIDLLSIVTTRSFMYDGKQFHVELHGEMEGIVCWIISCSDDVVHVEEEPELDIWTGMMPDEVEPMVLMSFLTHVSKAEGKVERVVLRAPQKLVEKTVGRLLSRPESRITNAAAREIVRDCQDQVVGLGGFVKLPEALDGVLSEYIARGCCRRAKYDKINQALEVNMFDDRLKLADTALRGSYVSGLSRLITETGKSLVDLLSRPVTDVIAAGKSESWDVMITPESLSVVIKCRWDPKVRGRSSLGRLRRDMGVSRKASSTSVGAVSAQARKVVTQAWDWFVRADLGSCVQQKKCVDGAACDSVEGSNVILYNEVERKPVKREMGSERESLVATLTCAYDAVDLHRSAVVTAEHVGVAVPELTPVVLSADAYSGMQEEYDENFPGLATVDFDVRPWLAADEDREYSCVAEGFKAKGFEDFPKSMALRTTALRCGVSGVRPSCAFETGLAFGKRVGGAPDYQYPDVSIEAAKRSFDKFASACFVSNWKSIVERRVAEGLGRPRESSVRDVVSKLSPSNVAKVKSEDFSFSQVIMDEYHAMVKRQPKDKLEESVAFEHTACQTIMYQPSKATNAYCSSILGEIHDVIDEVLRPGIMINCRRDKSFVEERWNAAVCAAGLSSSATRLVEVDVSQCDKSQTSRNLLRYFYFLEQMGLGDLVDLWKKVIGSKVAVSHTTRYSVGFFAQVVSGLFATISMNSIITGEAYVDCVDLRAEDIVALVVSGDDALGKLKSIGKEDLGIIAEKFATEYNFEVKVFEPKIGYWCGRYVIVIDGYEFFVKDPERIFSALARPRPTSYKVDEAFESFVDDTRAYCWEEIVVKVAEAVKMRNDRRVAPLSTCRGIATIRVSKELFASRFDNVRVIEF